MSVLTGLGAAALVWTAGAPDVAAAGVGTTLTPADAQEEEDEEASQAYHDHEEPVCREKRKGPELGNLEGIGTDRLCRDSRAGTGVGDYVQSWSKNL